MLVLMHKDGEIDEDKCLILNHTSQRTNLHGGLPYWKQDSFNLENMQKDECEVDFHFKKPDIYRLAATFNLPHTFRCPNRTTVQPIEALCICLKCFA